MVALLLALLACDAPKDAERDSGEDTGDTSDTGTDTAETGDTSEDTAEDTDTAPDLDADDDGYDDVARGGDDCDDTNAWVHPGAIEYCDAVDQDCDGDTLATGSCATVTDSDAALWWAYEVEVEGYVAVDVIRDVSGDDQSDFVLGVGPHHHYSVMPPTAPGQGPLSIPSDAWLRVDAEGGLHSFEILDAGDVDGDGVPDLGFADHDGLRIDLHFGPFGDGGVREVRGDADVTWYPHYQDPYSWGMEIVAGVDFDGDGREDMAASNYSEYPERGFQMDIQFGGDWDDPCGVGSGTFALPFAIGDIDADGLPDLAAYEGQVFLLSGAEIRGVCGGAFADAAIATFARSDVDVDPPNAWAAVGDWTGDGLDDMVAGISRSSTVGDEHGEVYLFSGDIRGDFLSSDAAGSYVGAGDDANLGYYLHADDVDGDEVPDLVVNADWQDYLVLRGGNVPALRSELPERRLQTGMPVETVAVGDVDGDGFADIIGGVLAEDVPMRIGVWRGFDVPWDDPTYW